MAAGSAQQPAKSEIDALESLLFKAAAALGDVEASAADVEPMRREFGWAPRTPVEVGVPTFIEWWRAWMDRGD